jgi:hypothetical protein
VNKSTGIASKAISRLQSYLMRLSVDDQSLGLLILAIGAIMIYDGINDRKKVIPYVQPVGTTWLQETGF